MGDNFDLGFEFVSNILRFCFSSQDKTEKTIVDMKSCEFELIRFFRNLWRIDFF